MYVYSFDLIIPSQGLETCCLGHCVPGKRPDHIRGYGTVLSHVLISSLVNLQFFW